MNQAKSTSASLAAIVALIYTGGCNQQKLEQKRQKSASYAESEASSEDIQPVPGENPCGEYSQDYHDRLSDRGPSGSQLTSNETKNILYSVCREHLNRASGATEPATRETTPLPEDKTPAGGEDDSQVFQLFETEEKDKSAHSGIRNTVTATMATALKPLFSAAFPPLELAENIHATPLPEKYFQSPPASFQTETFALSSESENGAEHIVQTLLRLGHGVGAGLGLSAGVGFGTKVGGSLSLEMIYHTGNKSKWGEIAFFCSPGISVGAGYGVSASASLSVLKTLGCEESANYEGGFLNFPFAIAGSQAQFSLGIDPTKFTDFINYIVKANWEAITSPEKLSRELDLLDKKFVERLKESKSSLELISFYIYMFFLNTIIGFNGLNNMVALVGGGDPESSLEALGENLKRNTIDQVIQNEEGTGAKLPLLLKKVAEQLISLDFLNSPLKYPSLKSIFIRLSELLPASDFPYSHHVLEKLIATFGGCDTISLSFNPGVPASTDSLTKFGTEVSYSYSVNPIYTEIGDNQNYDKKTVLFLESFRDFVTPAKWLEAGKKFEKNVEDTAETVADEGKKIVDKIFLTSPSAHLTGPGDAIVSYTGLDAFGPLEFVGKMANVADPRYLYDNCLKASGEHTLEMMKSLGKLFDTSPINKDPDNEPP